MKKIIFVFILFLFTIIIKSQTIGFASYYHKRFHNRKTASGALYKKDSLTCAHRVYPFGTMLKVKNLNNNKEVVVKVTDRGPFVKRRIIDLSYAAAKELEMFKAGTVRVEISMYEDSIQTVLPSDTLRMIDNR